MACRLIGLMIPIDFRAVSAGRIRAVAIVEDAR